MLLEIDPNTGSLTKKYVYTPDGQILKQAFVGQSEPNEYFYIHDRLGSVRLVVDENGVVKNSYTYDPFGNLFTAETAENTENPFKFTGQWYDEEISQYYLRARQYDPQIMRFTGRDPVKGGYRKPISLHSYLYCLNNPINSTDESGKSPRALVAPIIAGHATHDLAILFVVYGIATNRDFAIGLGLVVEQCITEVMTLTAIGANIWDAIVYSVKQKDRDDFGKLKEIGKDYGQTLEEVRDAIHRAKEKPPYKGKPKLGEIKVSGTFIN